MNIRIHCLETYQSFVFFINIILLGSLAKAQDVPCLFDYKHQQAIEQFPELSQQETKYEDELAQYIQNKSLSKSSSTNYIIPVVFHVLHDNGIQNISDAQICDAITLLNEDFGKKNADTIYTISTFTSIAASAGIEFRLATIDPSGNPTSGINRYLTPLTYSANDSSKINQWPPSQYLNIWVVDSLDIIGGIAGVQGYAYGPVFANANPNVDGILIRHDCVGRFGSGGPYQAAFGRILSHEMGHYLNLLHVWGYSFDVGMYCTGDDYVADTPPTKGSIGCTNLYLSTCGYIDNVQNFMNYSYCYTMFTQGQVNRMTATLNSAVANRNNLWSNANLILTGTLNSNPYCSTVGINELRNDHKWFIVSNPIQDKAVIKFTKEITHATLVLYNSFGQIVKEFKDIDGSEYSFDTKNLANGLYYFVLTQQDVLFYEKVIIEHR